MFSEYLSASALRGLLNTALDKACTMETAGTVGGMVFQQVAKFVQTRLVDPSQGVVQALERSNTRAWRALEIVLAGDSLLSRFDRAEDRGFRNQLRGFLGALSPQLPSWDEAARKRCLDELRAARKAGLLGGKPSERTARTAATFASYADNKVATQEEWKMLDQLGARLEQAGYKELRGLVTLRVEGGSCLIAMTVRFFFRQELAADPKLMQGATADRVDEVSQDVEAGFGQLGSALQQQGQRLESMLDSLHAVVVQTHEAVLDVQAELRRQGQQNQELHQMVASLLGRLDLGGRPLRPGDSMSVRNDAEQNAIKQAVGKYRALPQESRAKMPALLNAIGKLEVAAGDFDSAQKDFDAVAKMVKDDSARGEAFFNAYLAALERGQKDDALKQLVKAAECDRERFALFSMDKYEPVRILGAGGFGVTFHCRYRATGGEVAVKALTPDGLERDVSAVFQEAGALDSIAHPAIIRLRECDFADAAKKRPYLVMEFFDGMTLEDFVRTWAKMPPAAFVSVFLPIAEALEAAHQRGVLHRDVKPANLLVRPGTTGPSSWQVKVIDFGLAMKQSVMTGTTARTSKTVVGSSIAGTVDYAAPEQMGKLPGARVGPPADVYGFGRTACFALFGTPSPLRAHWGQVSDGLANLLEACLHEAPQQRIQNFTEVTRQLKALAQAPASAAKPPPLPAIVPTPTGTSDLGWDAGFGGEAAAPKQHTQRAEPQQRPPAASLPSGQRADHSSSAGRQPAQERSPARVPERQQAPRQTAKARAAREHLGEEEPRKSRGFGLLRIVVVLLVLAGVGAGAFYYYEHRKRTREADEQRWKEERLLGKWVTKEVTRERKKNMTWEFLKEGRLKVGFEGITIKGTYQWVDNNHIEITFKKPGSDKAETTKYTVDELGKEVLKVEVQDSRDKEKNVILKFEKAYETWDDDVKDDKKKEDADKKKKPLGPPISFFSPSVVQNRAWIKVG
jgi:serine/threonine protein kinase